MTARNARWPGAFYQPLMFGLAVLLGGIAALVWFLRYSAFSSRGLIGIDRALFVELGNRWQSTGSMYAPWQFQPYAFDQGAGRTDVANMPGLYPPIVSPMFAVLDVLPAFLWWAIPLTALGCLIVRMRPSPWAWPLLAAILALPQVSACVMTGNTNMWIAAGIAAGLTWGWPALVVLVKPTFAPFLLAGVRHRSFWIGAAILGAVSLLFAGEWFRYVEVIRNAQSPGLLYSIGDYPFMFLPVVGWLGSKEVQRQHAGGDTGARVQGAGRVLRHVQRDEVPLGEAGDDLAREDDVVVGMAHRTLKSQVRGSRHP